jgi:antitoxin (DNA-binding transcriptional repressor) of toxin-antitoxin stability system
MGVMNTITVTDLQHDPLEQMNRAEAGESLLVVRDGRPVAELRPVPASPPMPRPCGLVAGAFTVPDDFDAPLPKEVMQGFPG